MAYPFVESPNVTKTGGRKIDLIVIHTMEMEEKGDTAEHCALWFRNPAAKVSAHYCVDADSIVQCVRDQDVAWHAPGSEPRRDRDRARRTREADGEGMERRVLGCDARALRRTRGRPLPRSTRSP